jgi:hypothetical protein
MFCGSAAGELLPPYVVYKSQNHYEAWRTGGPPGARYTSSPSGWFDMCIGEDWFKKLFLPHVRRQPGRKLLIGGNLASHISMEVIRLCKENDIMFVCLPANSTDKMQPLDVGIFGPMKSAWRKQLLSYAEKDPAAQLLQKTEFPRMLKELVESLKPMEHLPKAFEKCGLCPINREKVLDRLPSIVQSEEIARHIDSALLKKLEVRRFGEASKKKPRGKKTPAGQSYTAEEDSEEEEEEEDDDEVEEDEEDEEEADDVEEQEQEGVDVEDVEEEGADELPDLDVPGPSTSSKSSSNYVVAVYEGQWFLAEICGDQKNVGRGYTRLSYMVIKGTNTFTWGDKEDLHVTCNEDILLRAVEPEPVNSRGHLGLNKKDFVVVVSRVVVVYPFFSVLAKGKAGGNFFYYNFSIMKAKAGGNLFFYKFLS